MALLDYVEGWSLDRASGNEAGLVSLLMTASGSPGQAAAPYGYCRTFNGSSQYFSTSDHANIPQGNNSWSGLLDVYLTNTSSAYIILGKDHDGSNRDYTLDFDNSGNRFRFNLFSGTALICTATADIWGAVSATTWYTLFFGHDATNDLAFIGVNGSKPNTITTGGATPGSSTAPLNIGRRSFSGFEGYLNGRIKRVLLYNRILTADEQLAAARRGRARRAA